MTERQAESFVLAVGLLAVLGLVAGIPFAVYLLACWRVI